jgi:DNA-binding transcriptional regulator YiaG
MTNTKTIIYEDFGFPITLVDVPIKLVMGEEILDIDMHKLEISVLKHLIFKATPLTGSQLRFIRKFLRLSTTDFAKKLGVTHPTILSWEKEEAHINPTADMCVRIEVLKLIQDEDFRKFITQVSAEILARHKKEQEAPIQIDRQQLIAC